MITETPLRRDAEANRHRVVAAALDVFNDVGIDAGVEQIAQRAGVGVGTLYRRFPTKDALIGFLVHELLADLTRVAIEAQSVADGRGLEHFLRAAADRLAAHRGCLQRLARHENEDTTARDGLRARMEMLVADARAHGTVRDDVVRADVTMITWCLHGVIAAAGDDAPAACARALDLMLAGLRPPG